MSRTELAGLPDGGPASLAGARLQLGITDPEDVRDDDRIATWVAAVNRMVRSWRCSQAAVDQDDWAGVADVVAGANMLVARMFRRKNSPAGVESFGSDGAVYVSRSDPDIAQLLQLGQWRGPQLG